MIDEGLGKDDGLDFPSERLFQDVVLGEMNCFVGIIGCVEFGLGWEEDIIRDATWLKGYLLKGNSSLAGLSNSLFTFCIVFY